MDDQNLQHYRELEYFWQQNRHADVIVRRSSSNDTPYLVLDIEIPWQDMLEEARAIDHMFVRHRPWDGQAWNSVCIHGLGADKTEPWGFYPEYRDQREEDLCYTWTTAADRCPVIRDFFENHFPYVSYTRLRIMRLDPGGYITPHRDHDRPLLSAVNISLNNPPGCEMIQAGIGLVPFRDGGSVIWFNTGYEHAVWNRSQQARYHIIVHGEQDPVAWSAVVDASVDH